MAVDKKLSGLTEATTLGDADLSYVVSGGVSKRITWANFKSAINAFFYTKAEADTQISNRVVGFKNLLHNPNRILQTRGTTGGRRQVIDASNVQLGGSYVISFLGTATVRIYEATTLGTSDALTTWSELTAGASASGTVVTVTAGKYIKVEFSTTDFSFAQFEKGTIPSSFEQRAELELYLCYPYFEYISSRYYFIKDPSNRHVVNYSYKSRKRIVPSLTETKTGFTTYTSGGNGVDGFWGFVTSTDTDLKYIQDIYVNAEHFTDTYYEDRWF